MGARKGSEKKKTLQVFDGKSWTSCNFLAKKVTLQIFQTVKKKDLANFLAVNIVFKCCQNHLHGQTRFFIQLIEASKRSERTKQKGTTGGNVTSQLLGEVRVRSSKVLYLLNVKKNTTFVRDCSNLHAYSWSAIFYPLRSTGCMQK